MTNGLEVLAQTVVSGNLLLVYGLGLYVLTRYTQECARGRGSRHHCFHRHGWLGSVLLWLCAPIIPGSPVPKVDFTCW